VKSEFKEVLTMGDVLGLVDGAVLGDMLGLLEGDFDGEFVDGCVFGDILGLFDGEVDGDCGNENVQEHC
jgi:hypothetical protein